MFVTLQFLITFSRLNYFLHQLNPFGYHFVNILLHCVVCLLYHRFISSVTTSKAVVGLASTSKTVTSTSTSKTSVASLSTFLFAVHPIHTEAVTGVVGRAELLSSIFFLLTIMIYRKSVKSSNFIQKLFCYFLCLLTAALAMFSKEQGITVLGICFVVEVFFVHRFQDDVRRRFSCQSNNNNKLSSKSFTWRAFAERTAVLILIGLSLILVRLKVVMGSTLPVFTSFDNPATHEPAPTKQLTW